MNKKGVLPIAWFVILIAALFLFNVIGIGVIFGKLSDSPIIIVALFIGFIILLKGRKK